MAKIHEQRAGHAPPLPKPSMRSAFLKQIAFGIKHLPPTIPSDKQQEIDRLFAGLTAKGSQLTDQDARTALIAIGKIEWPYRHAYHDMVMACCSHTQHDLFLKELSPATRKRFEAIGGKDATVQEVVHSSLFEEKLSPEERYEIQEAALKARLDMHEFMKGQLEQRPKDYEKALAKALQEQQKLEAAIGQLTAMIPLDEHWGPEIEQKVQQFELGWSITEPDVTVEEVEHEIGSWKEMLAGSGEGKEEQILNDQ